MVLKVERPLLKILVCDDDPADRKLVRTYLREVADREIVMLEAGQKAEIEEALGKGRIDLVLMDNEMPEKSGMEWLAEIVEKRMAPVVMLTGSGSEEVAVQALQEGAVGYLPKGSLSKEKLVEAIDAALEKWRLMQQSRANQDELERLANFDSLTGLHNRRAILHRLDEHIKQVRRYEGELSLLMLDIDYFKKVNDQCGHLIGDEVLENVAVLMQQNVRNTDSVGRYGGEEFIIVLSETDLSSALIVAERLRKAIETAEMRGSEGNTFGITVSQGVSSYKLGEDAVSLISRADDALYRAKQNGRNRVETST
ncbi:MAG: diguanylate cyclase [Dehalococcoidia bacterium]|nr:MAG: diguanylate cyclase [Dehalococcoidia bacterium]